MNTKGLEDESLRRCAEYTSNCLISNSEGLPAYTGPGNTEKERKAADAELPAYQLPDISFNPDNAEAEEKITHT